MHKCDSVQGSIFTQETLNKLGDEQQVLRRWLSSDDGGRLWHLG